MFLKVKSFSRFITQIVRNRFRKGISTRDAFGISILLHLAIGGTIASMLVGSFYVAPEKHAEGIEFDLVTVKSNMNTADQLNGLEEYGIPNSEASKETGAASALAKGNMNREAFMMSSLASLSGLSESFSFIMHKSSADSLGGFSPLEGNFPGSEFDSFGRENGEGFGSGDGIRIYGGGGSGGGFCPTPRGY